MKNEGEKTKESCFELTSSPTELSTAFTDLVLSAFCMVFAFKIWPSSSACMNSAYRNYVWSIGVFGNLGVVSFLGWIAHGFKMSKSTNDLIWIPMNFFLGQMVGLFVVGFIYDLWGFESAVISHWVLFFIGLCFFIYQHTHPESFLPFVIYLLHGMLLSFVGYVYLWVQGMHATRAYYMSFGVFTTIIASAVQALLKGRCRFTIIHTFDHNGLFHMIQMAGVVLLGFGQM
eukprot:TRINITY_DN10501_c0_g1_i1.p1 TRINITY_DN10501_c0_g1~~TRINITY_DN10501_c0_g1_i1.p1  ORF type:complete len:230 (-),score=27.32 TRINITY_DN10501_c0_g1_i1:123-812(-)